METFNADPRVIYDSLHGRWIATELSWDCAAGVGVNGPFDGHGFIDFFVSQTADPTGVWDGYYVGWEDYLPDYPAWYIE